MGRLQGLILAAGHGTRMKSDVLKVLHPVMGVPMLALVVDAVCEAGIERPAIVIGHQGERVRETLGDHVEYVVQEEQKGTGHAVSVAAESLRDFDDVLILYGDTPLVTAEMIEALTRRHHQGRAAATLLTAVVEDPSGLGRVIRDSRGEFVGIVEEADASHAEAAIGEINTAIACFNVAHLLECLPKIRADNVQGEYYLPDVFPLLLEKGQTVQTVQADDPMMVMGVNNRRGLALANEILRERILDRLMDGGVTVVDPHTTWVHPDARIGRDTTLAPFTTIEGPCSIGSHCHLGPMAHLIESRLGDNVRVLHSVVEASDLADGVEIGPYAHLRPDNVLGPGVRVGNFAELKNAHLGANTKVPHHAYLGDARVGDNVNIGAGAITVNYDGEAKHQTQIDEGSFIGCNSNLLAPVTVGRGGFVAAGSTINEDVPPGGLGIARQKQRNVENWVSRRFSSSLEQNRKDEKRDT